MKTTLVHLANGRTLEVKGEYADVAGILKPRATTETGQRELAKAGGGFATIALGAVLLTESAETEEKRAIGFARELEEAA